MRRFEGYTFALMKRKIESRMCAATAEMELTMRAVHHHIIGSNTITIDK